MDIICIGAGSTIQPSAEIIGAKAANLARMAALGLPVPPAFVLPIELCAAINNGQVGGRESLAQGLSHGIEFLERATGKTFGDRRRPLLVSVRSGAARSMPGMLDTVLNVGCTSTTVRGLIRMTGHPRFAYDCRRRFLESFGSVVLGIEPTALTKLLQEFVASEAAADESALDGEALERLSDSYQELIEASDQAVAEDPMQQLREAAEAVYRSWDSGRARTYRKLGHFDDLHGTAVTVEAMVFGNGGRSSGAGVAFSRDPSTGAAAPIIDVLFDAQGEDVVSGRRNPQTEAAIARRLPAVAAQLRDVLTRLEREFGDVQDVEFTIEEETLWILQTRAAKRTPQAALRFAIDLVHEGRITPAEALRRVQSLDLKALTSKRLVDPGEPIARGTGASAGIASGRAAFDSESAARLSSAGDPVILIRPDTSTADVAGFAVSAGIVTALGGRTAHAALVARQMGKPCIVGCTELKMDAASHRARLHQGVVREGDWLTIDAGAGAIYLGRGTIVAERPEAEFAEIARWRAAALAKSTSVVQT